MKPTSILRESSYRKLNVEQQQEAEDVEEEEHHEQFYALNLTQTYKPKDRAASMLCDLETNTISSTASSDSSTKCVQIDPRVTVTELFEDDIGRAWYTESKLDKFKCKTISTAQRYLGKHPDLVPVYNKPRLDPVTGTFRKKALFTMPVLMAADERRPIPSWPKTCCRTAMKCKTWPITKCATFCWWTPTRFYSSSLCVRCSPVFIAPKSRRSSQAPKRSTCFRVRSKIIWARHVAALTCLLPNNSSIPLVPLPVHRPYLVGTSDPI